MSCKQIILVSNLLPARIAVELFENYKLDRGLE